jgi:hypothetical protein
MLAEHKLHFDAILHGVDSTLSPSISRAIALTQKSNSAPSKEMRDRKSRVIVISLLSLSGNARNKTELMRFSRTRQWICTQSVYSTRAAHFKITFWLAQEKTPTE